jgi:hypothetical protein
MDDNEKGVLTGKQVINPAYTPAPRFSNAVLTV